MPVQKAIIVREEGLAFATDIPIPKRSQGELLVKIASTSVNPIDAAIGFNFWKPDHYPKILGGDVAGIVVEADDDSQFKKGDAVYALAPGALPSTKDGSYTEYAVLSEAWTAKVPSKLPLEQAGGLPLVALTAWQAIIEADPQPSQKILIFGASGGVGHIAVQVSKALGLYVVAVAGPTSQEYIKTELHADEVVDYSKQDFSEVYADTKFDIVLDSIGKDTAPKAYKLLHPKGFYAHIRSSGTSQEFIEKVQKAAASGEGPRVGLTLVKPNGAQLKQLSDLVEEGKVKLTVQKTIPLELEAIKAVFQQVVTGSGIRGKVVIQVS